MRASLVLPRALVLALALTQACAKHSVPPRAEPIAGTQSGDRDPSDAGALSADAGAATPPSAASSRTILDEYVDNARDLGGIELSGGQRVRAGLLFRGPPLAGLEPEGCAALAQLGLRTVIDLRIESESLVQPESACALQSAQLLAAPLPVPYNVSPQDYIADLDAGESIARVFQVLGDEQQYPVYFHCTWGRDRTGVLAAVILLALGAEPEAIMQDYLVSRDTVGAYPMSLMAALTEIEQRGGADAYLAGLGVTEQQLRVLRAHASESAR